MDRNATVESLRERILIAALGSLAAACGDAARPAAPAPETTARPVVIEDTTTTSRVPTDPTETPPALPPTGTPPTTVAVIEPPPTPPRELPPGCYEPRSTMRSVGTGQPANPPPPSAYDKNGCLPRSEVTNGCCNGAIAGPRFHKDACCYTFPQNAPCCGRPFTVDGRATVAEVVVRAGWFGASSAAPAGVSHLDAALRRDLAEGWRRDARMEHASIASFARFVLDLVAVGAPADVMRDAGAALLDEVEHARLCFALASRFAGEPLAPAPLAAAAMPTARDFDEILRSAVIEGCVGETAAAFVASQRLAAARDPEARAALTRIAEDEARHAELAFRFVAWAIRERGEAARSVVVEAFASALAGGDDAAWGEAQTSAARRAFADMGLMNARDERDATGMALERIVRPAARALGATV